MFNLIHHLSVNENVFFSDSSNVDEYGYLAIGNFTIDSVLF